ncbi:MaoC/PaaZ C-terminal domain-containing protein [Paenibacillus doosanensis]|uniref:Bifunctional protein PaaZ n=1 Tax=Paenibacillus konkukensis TaxID=2020716 RepID=A0ABY4RYP3_9BACL|nr:MULTISPECIES: MaoC/PaaZ C-terminal domain-containing protein [Paenibacillus]MCS7458593.1 MaoC/PaaZ C-terminal domain-containing protein [Paenibacillus doosanensis]UQZ86885.1 Bifunctional protein PaaZ [Paenibacillus konkukensis]
MGSRSMFFEDYETGAVRQTTGRTVTEADIVLHAGQTGDFYPHHMDAQWCLTQEFRQRIAHGTLIFSMGVGMTAGEINPEAFSYGYDRLRFVKPVFIGDTIYAKASIKEKRDYPKRPDYGIVCELVEVFNQRGELALVCEHLLLVKRKLAGDAASGRTNGGTSI